MCDACQTSPIKLKVRTKLQAIGSSYHCSIVGTCLSFSELDKLSRKAKIKFTPNATDYQKHGAFVHQISTSAGLAKATNKFLDRKFANVLRQLSKIDSLTGLASFWQTSLENGRIPGPYWACITHPLADANFKNHLFGEVHMLSHLVGSSNRADIKRLSELETELNQYMDMYSSSRKHMRSVLQTKNETIALFEQELANIRRHEPKLKHVQKKLDEYRNGTQQKKALLKITELESQLIMSVKETADLSAQLSTNEMTIGENRRLSMEVATLKNEIVALETIAERKLTDFCNNCDAQRPFHPLPDDLAEKPLDLNGATIIYVGGRKKNIPNFKALVEKANGEFHHHDGGIEQSDHRLAQILSSGDVVMCPMDCVSHQASLTAKKFCKNAGKTFVPLRSSGLSSFVSHLQDFSQPN